MSPALRKPSRPPDRPAAPSAAAPDRSHGPGSSKPAPGLYIVATPIGNADDISLRALAVLRAADLVAAEDTRVTAKLFARHGIAARLTAYHDHNAERVRPGILAKLAAGAVVALVSDAGTPLISDPGYKLVRAAVAANVAVTALPGPSAVLTALVLSGLPPDRFLFAGFLDARTERRRRALAELAAVPASLVFFESAQRLATSLADMRDQLGARDAAVGRELTKRFEEMRRGTLPDLAAHYHAAGPPKGEVVVVVGPPRDDVAPVSVDALLRDALAHQSLRDAADAVAKASGRPRREVYARALALARGSAADDP
ncbi:MAG: 16S rRNA (cytidine(1402)-2'-O)-methyltransferase [Proteobacteria bacterium]|nr:16S rRNA (cytidine(1402)-2'-O)-methyltransferase [Pseudomonadota bacterium]